MIDLKKFRKERQRQNENVLSQNHLGVKRFFNLDANTYTEGALPGHTKELLGLVASAVLRCNDCIDYHLEQSARAGYSREQLIDALNVALVVGGSIVIPHFRHAVDSIDQLEEEGILTATDS